MERMNKKVSLVVVVAMLLVSTFFTPTALAVRHTIYHEEVSATAEPDPDDHHLVAAAKPDPDHHDHIEVTSAAADQLGPDDHISSGLVRRKVDVSVTVVCNIMLALCNSCKIGCVCVPLGMLPVAGLCFGICCKLDPPPGPQPKSPSPSSSPLKF